MKDILDFALTKVNGASRKYPKIILIIFWLDFPQKILLVCTTSDSNEMKNSNELQESGGDESVIEGNTARPLPGTLHDCG